MSDMEMAGHLFWSLMKKQGIPRGLSIGMGYDAVEALRDDYIDRAHIEKRGIPGQVLGTSPPAGFWITYTGNDRIPLPQAFSVWESRKVDEAFSRRWRNLHVDGQFLMWGYLDDKILEAERERMGVPA